MRNSELFTHHNFPHNRMGGFYIRPLEYNKTPLFSSDKPLKTGAFVFMKHFKFRVCIGRIWNPPLRNLVFCN